MWLHNQHHNQEPYSKLTAKYGECIYSAAAGMIFIRLTPLRDNALVYNSKAGLGLRASCE